MTIFDVINDFASLLPAITIRLDVQTCIIGIGLIGWTNLEIKLWMRFR